MNKTNKDNMNLLDKETYIRPECGVIELEEERFFCTSIYPHGDNSVDYDYDDDTEVGGGDIDIWL